MNLLREYIRELERAETRRLNEGVFQDAIEWVSEKGSAGISKLKQFMSDLKLELEETGYGGMLLQKLATGEELDSVEVDFLKDQMKDVAKGGFLAGLFVLPGGGCASAALVKLAKKYNIDLMPSSFNN